jgi:hypothetical protein
LVVPRYAQPEAEHAILLHKLRLRRPCSLLERSASQAPALSPQGVGL